MNETLFTKTDVNEIANDLVELTMEEIDSTILDASWQNLVSAAQNFLKIINSIEEDFKTSTKEDIQQSLKDKVVQLLEIKTETQEALIDKDVLQIFKADKKSLNNVFNSRKINLNLLKQKHLYIEALKFEHYLDKYLLQSNKMPRYAAYTLVTDQEIQTYVSDIEFLYLGLTGSDNNLKLNDLSRTLKKINKNEQLKTLEQLIQEQGESEEIDLLQHIQAAQAAYFGVQRRLDAFFARNKKEHVVYKKDKITGTRYFSETALFTQKQGGKLLWKENDNWIMITVNNLGDVKEAYLHALTEEHGGQCLCNDYDEVEDQNSYYKRHQLISAFVRKFLTRVDSTGAITEEDIITKCFNLFGGQQIQLSAKSIGSSPASFTQYKNAAYTILEIDAEQKNSQSNKIISTEKLKNLLKNNGVNRYVQQLESKANKIIEDEINRYFNDLKLQNTSSWEKQTINVSVQIKGLEQKQQITLQGYYKNPAAIAATIIDQINKSS